MISVSKETAIRGDMHRYFFDVKEESLEHLSQIITTSVWSPIVWNAGMRAKKNFKSAEYLALDFDDGKWTLACAEKWCKQNNFAYIIGTSKSHQKEKTTASGHRQPAVDRFRLVVPFETPLTDRQLYEYNMRKVMETVPCDPSCKDGGRFFFPCKKIYSLRDGYPFKPEKTIAEGDASPEEIVKLTHVRAKRYATAGIIPAWILMSIKYGVETGGRHTQCYKIGAELYHYGYSIESITNLIISGPLKDIGVADARRAVSNGWHRARAEAEAEHKRQRAEAQENGSVLKFSRKDERL
jgi:hypothetical protein